MLVNQTVVKMYVMAFINACNASDILYVDAIEQARHLLHILKKDIIPSLVTLGKSDLKNMLLKLRIILSSIAYDPVISLFQSVLSTNPSIRHLSRIINDLSRLHGNIQIDVVSVSTITQSEKSYIAQTIGRLLQHPVTIHNKIDRSIISGIIVRFDWHQIDMSLGTELSRACDILTSVSLKRISDVRS